MSAVRSGEGLDLAANNTVDTKFYLLSQHKEKVSPAILTVLLGTFFHNAKPHEYVGTNNLSLMQYDYTVYYEDFYQQKISLVLPDTIARPTSGKDFYLLAQAILNDTLYLEEAIYLVDSDGLLIEEKEDTCLFAYALLMDATYAGYSAAEELLKEASAKEVDEAVIFPLSNFDTFYLHDNDQYKTVFQHEKPLESTDWYDLACELLQVACQVKDLQQKVYILFKGGLRSPSLADLKYISYNIFKDEAEAGNNNARNALIDAKECNESRKDAMDVNYYITTVQLCRYIILGKEEKIYLTEEFIAPTGEQFDQLSKKIIANRKNINEYGQCAGDCYVVVNGSNAFNFGKYFQEVAAQLTPKIKEKLGTLHEVDDEPVKPNKPIAVLVSTSMHSFHNHNHYDSRDSSASASVSQLQITTTDENNNEVGLVRSPISPISPAHT